MKTNMLRIGDYIINLDLVSDIQFWANDKTPARLRFYTNAYDGDDSQTILKTFEGIEAEHIWLWIKTHWQMHVIPMGQDEGEN